ncbi:hypothetical protein INT47_012910 [Mucor saturninus]|uniref:UBA domain-containing protein n=1 Tax=Mucor saturninus TaxID=64648 RepID=A0A8H7QN32_9FUNG|nr:hypothetical protein INT47_012910 [Mucor saturninus]
MSQETSYTSVSDTKAPRGVPVMANTPKTSHRYSSSAHQPRHYASPEESEAVFPVFTTPTQMYIVQELNQQPRGSPQYTASPKMPTQYSPTQQQQQQQQQQQTYSGTKSFPEPNPAYTPSSPLAHSSQQTYGRTRGESSPARPSMETVDSTPSVRNNYTASPHMTSATPQKDLLLAQLIDMGFSLEASQVAMAASNSTNLQEVLDILVQNVSTPPYRPTPAPPTSRPTTHAPQPPPHRENATTPPHRENSATPPHRENGTVPPHRDYYATSPRENYTVPPRDNYNTAPTRDNYNTAPTRDNYNTAPTRDNYNTAPTRDNFSTPSDYNTPPSKDRPSRANYTNATGETYNPSNPPPPPSTNRPNMPKENVKSDDDDEDEREQEERFRREQEERRREYLDQIKREKPIPPTPSARPTAPSPSTYEPISVFADNERKQGNYLFNKGLYDEAESAYSVAIDALPPGHSELVLLFNNRAAARLKMNKYTECITDCSQAIEIARVQMNTSNDPTWKAQWIKALHRKASALEGLCLFEKAIQVYEEYIRLDGSRSAQVSQGILRCQQALLEKKQQPPPQPPPRPTGPTWKPANDNSAFPDIDFNMFIPQQTPEQKANLEEINKSKAVKEMRDRERKKESEDAERLMNQDKVDAKIAVWKTGKDRNLRSLLGSLQLILWPGVQWKSVTMSELLEPRKCKITYMKAIAKVHPDKLPANATVEQRMLASGIFTTLNQAWDLFKLENNL